MHLVAGRRLPEPRDQPVADVLDERDVVEEVDDEVQDQDEDRPDVQVVEADRHLAAVVVGVARLVQLLADAAAGLLRLGHQLLVLVLDVRREPHDARDEPDAEGEHAHENQLLEELLEAAHPENRQEVVPEHHAAPDQRDAVRPPESEVLRALRHESAARKNETIKIFRGI